MVCGNHTDQGLAGRFLIPTPEERNEHALVTSCWCVSSCNRRRFRSRTASCLGYASSYIAENFSVRGMPPYPCSTPPGTGHGLETISCPGNGRS